MFAGRLDGPLRFCFICCRMQGGSCYAFHTAGGEAAFKPADLGLTVSPDIDDQACRIGKRKDLVVADVVRIQYHPYHPWFVERSTDPFQQAVADGNIPQGTAEPGVLQVNKDPARFAGAAGPFVQFVTLPGHVTLKRNRYPGVVRI